LHTIVRVRHAQVLQATRNDTLRRNTIASSPITSILQQRCIIESVSEVITDAFQPGKTVGSTTCPRSLGHSSRSNTLWQQKGSQTTSLVDWASSYVLRRYNVGGYRLPPGFRPVLPRAGGDSSDLALSINRRDWPSIASCASLAVSRCCFSLKAA
jgi:hypothetical protein